MFRGPSARLEIHERRSAGEISGFYMLQGRSALRHRCLHRLSGAFYHRTRIGRFILLTPGGENDLCGYDEITLAKYTLPASLLADIMVEIEQVLRVVGADQSTALLADHWQRFVANTKSLEQFHSELPGFVDRLAALPRKRNPLGCPQVLVTGDFFTRFSPFFMEGVREIYNEQGIILKPVDLSGLVLYGAYNSVVEAAGGWGLEPGGAALAKACTRIFRPDGKEYLRRWLTYQAERRSEEHYRRIFHRSGLLL